jgi:hypothetical protein
MPAPFIRLPGVNDDDPIDVPLGAAPQISLGAPEDVMSAETGYRRQGPFDMRRFAADGAARPAGFDSYLATVKRQNDAPSPPPASPLQVPTDPDAAARAAFSAGATAGNGGQQRSASSQGAPLAKPPAQPPAAPPAGAAFAPVRLESVEKTYTTTTHPMDTAGMKSQEEATQTAIKALQDRYAEANRHPVQVVLPAGAEESAQRKRAAVLKAGEAKAEQEGKAYSAAVIDKAPRQAELAAQEAHRMNWDVDATAEDNDRRVTAATKAAYDKRYRESIADAERGRQMAYDSAMQSVGLEADDVYKRTLEAAKQQVQLPSVNDQKLARAVQMMETLDREQQALDKYRARFDAEREQRAERADEAQMRAAQMGDRLDPNRTSRDRGVPQIALDAIGTFFGGMTRAHNGGRNVYLDSMEAARQQDYQGQLDRLAQVNHDLAGEQGNAAAFARGGQAKLADFEARRARALGDLDAHLKGIDVSLLPADEKMRLAQIANDIELRKNLYRAEQFKGQQSTVQDRRIDRDALARGSGAGEKAETPGMVVPDINGKLIRVRKGYEEEARKIPFANAAFKSLRENVADLEKIYNSLPLIGMDRRSFWSGPLAVPFKANIETNLHNLNKLGGRLQKTIATSIPEQTMFLDDAARLRAWLGRIEGFVNDWTNELGTAEASEAPTATGYATGNTGRVRKPDTSKPDTSDDGED